MNNSYILFVFLSFLLITGCKAPQNVIYFNDVNRDDRQVEKYETHHPYTTYIFPDDILTITVSNVDPMAVAAFNLPLASFPEPGDTQISTTTNLQTFLVDNEGFINFPVIGKVKLGGLSKQQAIDLLQSKISEYAENPIVTVQILNYKISVMGEVVRPGEYFTGNRRISILDAISKAGDLTINGERTNILLIRDNNGTIETHRFDLTSSELFKDPYYYLRQNDIVYAEPNKAKQKNARYSQAEQFNISVLSTILSAVSIITSLGIALIK